MKPYDVYHGFNFRHMNIFCNDFYPPAFYVFEKVTYAFFIVLWLALKTDRRLLPWALTGCSVIFVLVFIVILNEIVLDQVRGG